VNHSNLHSKVTPTGLLITLGIIFGDIGTSPLYVLKAIAGQSIISDELILGGLSCIFWTLTLQTTLKYVIITLRADNKGEGGIFSLYTLVKRVRYKWLILPAIIGGSALLADGVITPAISVSSAIEGLKFFDQNINTIPIVILILTTLFFVQQFGTGFVGRFFGPVMLVWFIMLSTLGVNGISNNFGVLKAISPIYMFDFLMNQPNAFWVLGAVFLCTTGAEGLYSDMGHCGKSNIRVSWIFVKISLLLNYFGQGAWLLNHKGSYLNDINPFYELMPSWFRITGLVIATLATVVASQALISASFTLINEAIRLNLWPKVKIKFPSNIKGQIYIPSINWLLYIMCIATVLYFKESKNMEAAYGLTINIDMIMTSILLVLYMRIMRYPSILIVIFIFIYGSIEFSFLIANSAKFLHGGYVSFILSGIVIFIMYSWYKARKIRNRYVEFVSLKPYLPLLNDLSHDPSISKYSTHLVYLTSANNTHEIESGIIYSIMQKQPKKSDIYWFVHVDVLDEPYTMNYKVTSLTEGKIYRIDFYLGFRIAPKINLLFRKVLEEMVKNMEVDIGSRYESLNRNNIIGDFRFVVIDKYISYDNELSFMEKLVTDVYRVLRYLGLSDERAFGLDTSSVSIEKVPLIIREKRQINLTRIK